MAIDITKPEDMENLKEKYGIGEGSVDWYSLEEGDNKVRVIEIRFEEYGNHYLPSKNSSFACLGKDKGCPICKKGQNPSVKLLTWVIDREDDDKIKVMEFPWTVAKGLTDLANDNDYGIEDGRFPYDVNIKRRGSGKQTEYNVMPTRNEEDLTEEQEAVIKELKDLNEIVKNKKKRTANEFNVDYDADEEDYSNGDDDEDIPVIEDDDDIDPEDVPF